MAANKKDDKKPVKGPQKKSKVVVNPPDTSLNVNYLPDDYNLIKSILNANKSLDYQLTETEKKSLEYKAEKYSVPFNILESVFKCLITELDQSKTFSNLNSLINNGQISEFFAYEKNLKPTDYGVPGKISDKLLLTPRNGFGITRRLRNQIQVKILD
jgi:hypothetical protein